MYTMRALHGCVLVLLALAVAARADAQRRSPFTFEGSIGRGTGTGGGDRVDRSGLAIDGTVAWRGRRDRSAGPIIGASGAWQGRRGDTDWCKVQPSGECVLTYPSFTMVSLLGGWELARGTGASLRLFAGGGLFVRELGPGAAGFSGRVDLGTPVRGGVALIGSGRIAVTAPRGNSHTLRAATVGVRIH